MRDERAVAEAMQYAFPIELEPLPDLEGESVFLEYHARCFEKYYTGSGLAKRLDRGAYTQCLNAA